jgi:hypothetical protein
MSSTRLGSLTVCSSDVQWQLGRSARGVSRMAWRYVIGIVVGGAIGFGVGCMGRGKG